MTDHHVHEATQAAGLSAAHHCGPAPECWCATFPQKKSNDISARPPQHTFRSYSITVRLAAWRVGRQYIQYSESGEGYLVAEQSSFCTFSDLNTKLLLTTLTTLFRSVPTTTHGHGTTQYRTTLTYSAPDIILNGITYTRVQ